MSYINAIDEFIDFYFNKHFQTHIYNSETSDEDNYSDNCLISSYNDEEDWNNWGDDCELLIQFFEINLYRLRILRRSTFEIFHIDGLILKNMNTFPYTAKL